MANSVVNQVKVGSTTYDMKPYLGSATSGDAASATAWTDVDAVATSDSYDTVFNKVTKMVKNVRYLYSKLGTTDFSGISSTVSGALTTLNTNKAASTHNHDGVYSATNHTHSNYSTTGHTHSNYSTTGHTHSNYASSIHNHDTAYAAKSHTHSEYSTTGHTHSNYSTTGHTHSNYSTTGHTHAYIATSNIVTSQTNSTSKVPAASLVYSMNTTLSSLNDALNQKAPAGYGLGTYGRDISNQNLVDYYDKSGFYYGTNITNSPILSGWWKIIISSAGGNGYATFYATSFWNDTLYVAHCQDDTTGNPNFTGWNIPNEPKMWEVSRYVVNNENPGGNSADVYNENLGTYYDYATASCMNSFQGHAKVFTTYCHLLQFQISFKETHYLSSGEIFDPQFRWKFYNNGGSPACENRSLYFDMSGNQISYIDSTTIAYIRLYIAPSSYQNSGMNIVNNSLQRYTIPAGFTVNLSLPDDVFWTYR